MLTSLDQLQANFALVGDKSQYAGSMNQEYLSAVSTTQGATGLAANALSGLNITMGQALLPTVVAVSQKVTEAANVMRHWAQEHPAMTKAIMLFLGVGAGLLVLLGGLALAFGR
jgi:TP901 family phage tail tape measure protein